MKKNFLLVSVISLLAACQNNEFTDKDVSNALVEPQIELSILTEDVHSRANTLNPVSNWENGDKIGLYAVNQSTLVTYLGAKPNLAYQYSKTERKWLFDPTTDPAKDKQLYLHSGNATLYAFSPLNKTAEDLTAVPLNLNTNVDYLYGTHRVAPFYVNNQQTSIKIEMMHAQAYVGVRLKRSIDHPYSQTGNITSIKITGNTPSGQEAGYVKGTYPATGALNLSTGAINVSSATRDNVTIAGIGSGVIIPIVTNTTAPTTSLFYAMIAPEKSDVRKGFQLVVDGKTHFVPINNIEWKAGYQYIYTLTITGKGIDTGDDVNPSDPDDHTNDALIIRPWASGADDNYDF